MEHEPQLALVKSHTDKKGNVRYVWKFSTDFHPTRISTGIIDNPNRRRNRWMAEKYANEWVEEYSPKPSSKNQTVGQYAEDFYGPDCPYLEELRDEGREPGSTHITKYHNYIKDHILTDKIASVPLREITRQDVLAFRKRLAAKLGDKRRTVNEVLAVTRVIFSYAAANGVIGFNPTARVGSLRHTRKSTGAFTKAELVKLFPTDKTGPWTDVDARDILLMSLCSGMRPGEIRALRWGSVDLKKKRIHVAERRAAGSKRKAASKKSTKTGIDRLTFIPKRLDLALKQRGRGLPEGILSIVVDDERTHPPAVAYAASSNSPSTNLLPSITRAIFW